MMDKIPGWIDGVLQPINKLEAHKRGYRHRAVSVFVVRGSETLIQQRAASKYHTPKLWANTCCTHPHWEEDPAECAVRRLHEELGITGLNPVHRDQIEYRADVGNAMVEHEVVELFVAPAPKHDFVIDPNPDEVMAVRWINIHDLRAEAQRHPEWFTPWLHIYLNQYASNIFGAFASA